MKKIIVFLLLLTMGQLLPVVVQLPAADVLKERFSTKSEEVQSFIKCTDVLQRVAGKRMMPFAVVRAVNKSFEVLNAHNQKRYEESAAIYAAGKKAESDWGPFGGVVVYLPFFVKNTPKVYSEFFSALIGAPTYSDFIIAPHAPVKEIIEIILQGEDEALVHLKKQGIIK